jgi:hypothetical protein
VVGAAMTGTGWAVAVAEVPELDCRMVLFASDDGTPVGTLEVQAAYSYDEQDRLLGTDTYCLVVDGVASVYGGLARWTVGEDHVTFHLTPAAAGVLAVPRTLRIPLPAGEPARTGLADTLRGMVGEPAADLR